MPENLDYLAAKRAQAIVSANKDAGREAQDVDNLVTKVLGVLQEDGVYACGLYLLSRSQDKEKLIAGEVRAQMVGLLAELPFDWGHPDANSAESTLKYLSDKVTGDPHLERLLLAKQTLEQMLIYARYGAKAWKAED